VIFVIFVVQSFFSAVLAVHQNYFANDFIYCGVFLPTFNSISMMLTAWSNGGYNWGYSG
jgi:hypothetical protein